MYTVERTPDARYLVIHLGMELDETIEQPTFESALAFCSELNKWWTKSLENKPLAHNYIPFSKKNRSPFVVDALVPNPLDPNDAQEKLDKIFNKTESKEVYG